MKFGLWYHLRNPPQWKQPWGELYAHALEQIEAAETLGFDSIWTSEHHFIEDGYLPSSLVFLAGVAGRTRRVRLGTLVLLLPLHDPIRVAEDTAVLDLLSGGRVDLGVAAGYRVEEFEAFGVPHRERGKRMDEAVSILRGAWKEGNFSYKGSFFEIDELDVTPKPLQDPLPLFMGGGSKPAMRRAARLGCHLLPPPDRELIELYRDELEKNGKKPDEFRIKLFQPMYCCEDPEAGWKDVREHYLYMHNWYRRWYREAGDGTAPELTDPDALPRDAYFVGTPDDCAAAIRRLTANFNFEEFIFWARPPGLAWDKSTRSMELFAREVLPRFR